MNRDTIFQLNRGALLPTLLAALLFSNAGLLSAGESSVIERVKARKEPFADPLSSQLGPVLEKTVWAKEGYQGGAFRVLARKQAIARFPCSSCHGAKPVLVRQAFELTHGNVILNHGQGERALSCSDCHTPEKPQLLEDNRARKIDFDHSYQLCGQCHFRQKRDWLGGAHGKRVSRWAGERVVYSCASCHDPHSPRFEQRFPATYSVPLD
ncbi:hypothetical protein [Desulfogranum mediterraneum]|uniref:hypothetical protein n=1 Tax=Desulfogranum mediterraneum TaxID=160661 RepID=UPI00041D1AB7|nr:hypothetical protein [Desulfogranum mediterraneum]